MLNKYAVSHAVSPGSLTEKWLGQLGMHLHLAHIHFFVSALGMRKLTVQTNIESDPYLQKDFALAAHGTC
jgi:catechol 1,2-dioxygenase